MGKADADQARCGPGLHAGLDSTMLSDCFTLHFVRRTGECVTNSQRLGCSLNGAARRLLCRSRSVVPWRIHRTVMAARLGDHGFHGRRLWLSIAVLVAVVVAFPVTGASADTLQATNDKVVRTLIGVKDGNLRNVLLSSVDFYDAKTRASLPLAGYLRDQLAGRLRQSGFKVLQPQRSISDLWLVRCSWRRRGQRLSLTYMASPWRRGKRGEVRVVSSTLPLSEVPVGLLEPDVDSYARTLVHRLGLNERLIQPSRVHLRPVRVIGAIGGRRLNDYFNEWLGKAVGASNLLTAVNVEKSLLSVQRNTLRVRGIRPVAKPGMSLTGDLTAAQNEISAEVKVSDTGHLSITAVLHDDRGGQVSEASVRLPTQQLPSELRSELAAPPEPAMTAAAPISHGGLEVELATTHGEGVASYRAGSKITFLVRVNRAAYVYLFDFDSTGEAVLLYPAFAAQVRPLPPGRLLVLPDDGLPYELEVSRPFGKDLVWAVAVQDSIAVPTELTGDWSKAKVVMQRVRSLAVKAGAYAETQLIVETGP